jgi:glycosyltransferase involved in cell wall biosynthesis
MRILIIARHFPPAVAGGSRRPYLWARNLMALGCEVFVVAPDKLGDVPGIAVPHPHRDPPISGAPAKRALRDMARTWLRWPDADIAWAKRAAAATQAALPWKPDWVLTTSPPESTHFVGRALARKLGARWAADFRDPWIENALNPDRKGLRAGVEKQLAKWLVPQADLVISVNRWIADELKRLGARKPPLVIQHFAEPPPAPRSLDPDHAHLVYTGSFTLSHPKQDILSVLLPFEEAAKSADRLQLHLMGRLSEAEAARVQASPARAAIVVHGPQAYQDALALQAGADALLITAPPDFEGVPGKIAEYRAAGAPIIPCGEGAWIDYADLSRPASVAGAMIRTGKRSAAPDPKLQSTAQTAAQQLFDAMRAVRQPA